jgi:hypothetical protein
MKKSLNYWKQLDSQLRFLLIAMFIGGVAGILMNGCSTSNSNNSRYGTWNKVSMQKGKWAGKHNLAANKIQVIKTAYADDSPVVLDTSYVDNAGDIQLSMKPAPDYFHNGDGIVLRFEDHNRPFDYNYTSVNFVSDSTAFAYKGDSHFGNRGGYSMIESRLIRYCNKEQDQNEYLMLSFTNLDSTKTIYYKIFVNGMYDMASEIAPCK